MALIRIAFVGEEAAGARALQRVAASDHTLVGVLTASEPEGQGATVASVAAECGAPVIPARRVREAALADELRDREVDVLLNVHSLYIICAEVLAAPRYGAFNLHPGPLPDYAGLNAPSWAVVHGRDRHGVTLHWMEPGIDTGDVVARTDFDLTARDTGLTVSLRCAEKGLELVDDLLARLSEDPASVPRRPQDLTGRRYFGREIPHDGWIPWSSPAREVLDFVRAFDFRPLTGPWGLPKAKAPEAGEIHVDRLAGTDASAERPPGEVHVDDDGVFVATADAWVRVVDTRVDGQARAPHEVLVHGTTLS